MRAEYLRKTRKCAGNHRTWQNALFVQNLKHMFNFEQKNGFDGFPPLLEHCNWWYCPTSLFPCFRNYFVHLPCRCTFADFNVFCKSLPGRSMQLLQPGIPQLRPQSRLASNPSRGRCQNCQIWTWRASVLTGLGLTDDTNTDYDDGIEDAVEPTQPSRKKLLLRQSWLIISWNANHHHDHLLRFGHTLAIP